MKEGRTGEGRKDGEGRKERNKVKEGIEGRNLLGILHAPRTHAQYLEEGRKEGRKEGRRRRRKEREG